MTVGVRIVDDPAPSGDGMPVMDVPVFVGFAAKGPLHRPVALDSAAAYAAVFGGGLDLVQAGDDPSERLAAHLPPAVEAFFAGGGRRCHVIRVAGSGAAARFSVAGLKLATHAGAQWQLQALDIELAANSLGAWADRLELSARQRSQALHRKDRLLRGDLLRIRWPALPGLPGWKRVPADAELDDAQLADGWLWPQGVAEPLDPVTHKPLPISADSWLVERVQVDLALREPGQAPRELPGCGLAPDAANQPWWAPDANALYDAGADLTGWPLAGVGQAPAGEWLLLPVGVPDDFTTWQPARPGAGDAIERNGLGRFDASLFLDPAWADDLRGTRLMDWADEVRFFGDKPRRLQGLHGALGRDDACAAEASWVLVPDAVHPGWAKTAPLPVRDVVVTTTPDPVCHCPPPVFDPCAPPPPVPPQPPRIAFLPGVASPAVLPAGLDFKLRLRIDAGDHGAQQRLAVQLAGRPDFSDARTVADATPDGTPGADVTLNLAAGAWWLRARASRSGLTSAWSEPAELDVRPTGWRALPPASAVDAATRVNTALLNLCAASREHFALLSLPAHWRAEVIDKHVTALRADADLAEAASAASFAAIYHPWLLQRDADDRLRRHPPAGAVMGLLARRSRLHGAWGAPGAEPLPAALALAGEVQGADALEALGANPLALRAEGIAAVRSQTLSQDADWNALGVRRLFILLRRLCRREGQRFVFEPNDLTLRRGLERSFDALLHRLMQRGAFRGGDAKSSYLLKTAAGAEAAREIERGECSLLIQVAPSYPLRFLTLHLRRSGEQLLIEER